MSLKRFNYLFQQSYFLYDRSNIIKRTFINEINKFLPIYCSGRFYGETEKGEIYLITRKNAKSFFIKKVLKKELDLQIVKARGKKTETTDNKFDDFFFSRTGRKRKTKINTVDFKEVNKVFWNIVSTQLK